MLGLEKWLKVVDPEPVQIDQRACLRARHVRSACRACSTICPADAISFANRRLAVDAALCTRCGLCLGACPTAALQVRSVDEGALQNATAVRCSQAGGEGVEVPCLGALSVDHLVDLGSRCPSISLYAGDCEACSLARGGAVAKENLSRAAELLRLLGQAEVPVWQGARRQADAEPAISRRDLFALWRHNAVQTGRSLMPDRTVNPVKLPARVPARRLRWLKRFTATSNTRTPAPWPVRQVTGDCSGCGICAAFCPTGALSAREEGADWVLTFQAAACVDCRTCIDLCPRHVLFAENTLTVGELLVGARRDLVTVPQSQRPQAGGNLPFR